MDSMSAEQESRKNLIIRRRRPCCLSLSDLPITQEQLSTYLQLLDRPLQALLARDRLQRLEPDRFLYSSRPIQILQYQLVPSLEIRARWQEGRLQLLSDHCRIAGLGRWDQILDLGLAADLRPASGRLEALATLWLTLPSTVPGWCRSLASRALDQALDRMERRLSRGLVKDLQVWLR